VVPFDVKVRHHRGAGHCSEEHPMAESVWPTIHAERTALADDLAGLDPAAWATPSLCPGWTVADVLAHLLSLARMTPPRFVSRLAAARFDFNAYSAKQIALEGSAGPAATLAAFRAAESRESAPPGPKETWLGENLVHGEDIRRPLGIPHDFDLGAVTRVITFYAGSNPIIHGKQRLAGLTLEATDTDFTLGSGPLVRGPAVALMLAATGRKAALEELSGPGVATLQNRD
jgi:uncharacterized protein (TIGR03083 family)